jgi:methyl-accepting chemotaxis protein
MPELRLHPPGRAMSLTVASGDLSQEFHTERGGDFGRLLRALGSMEDTLTDLVTRIRGATDSIAVAARDIDGGKATSRAARRSRRRPWNTPRPSCAR